MITASGLGGVSGMLVLGADRLHEAHRLQPACHPRRLRELEKFRLVTQVCLAVGQPRHRARIECSEVVEWMVVELEEEIRTIREHRRWERIGIDALRPRGVRPTRPVDVAVRIRPPARVPRPVHARPRESVADRRALEWWQPHGGGGAG